MIAQRLAVPLALALGLVPAAAATKPPRTESRPAAAAASARLSPAEAERVVREAVAKADAIPDQAAVLVSLAFPDGPGDPGVAAMARHELEGYGQQGITPLAAAIPRVRPEHRAAVTESLVRTFRNVSQGIPADYLPGLESAVWFGTREAREIAMVELGRHRETAAVLTIVDAAVEDPALTSLAAKTLGQIQDPHARFWLNQVLNGADPEHRNDAAVALARIGGAGLGPLKDALRSEDPGLRVVAARALLPVAGLEDVSAIHEYVVSHPDDDPQVVEAMRRAGQLLEDALAARTAAESASPSPQ